MRRLVTLLTAMVLVVPLTAGATPQDSDGVDAGTLDAEGIERIAHVGYGDPEASGTTPFFASGTDLAFDGRYVYATEQAGSGNTEGGVHIIDTEYSDPDDPDAGPIEKVGFVDCPASQNDVATVEEGIVAVAYHSQTGSGCNESQPAADGATGDRPTAGVRLFDVSDPANPVALGASPFLPGGTHTLKVHPSGDYIYANPGGIANGGGTQQILDISDRNGPFEVHTYQPNAAGCHDFWFFDRSEDSLPSTFGDDLGICVGLTESTIWDLSDPTDPVTITRIANPLIQFHHTASVTDDGRYLVIGDEAFGAHDCEAGPTGAMWAYDISTPEAPVPLSYFGMHRAHDDASFSADRVDWCTAHQYNFIPGTSVMVASWYSGGLNVIDWGDDFLLPREVAHFRTDGDDYAAGEITNYWSAYWHDGAIYANDRVRGFDAFEWTSLADTLDGDPADASAQEITAAVQSMPDNPRGGWHVGDFSETPDAEQAAWLARAPEPSLAGLSPYSCRLSLLQ